MSFGVFLCLLVVSSSVFSVLAARAGLASSENQFLIDLVSLVSGPVALGDVGPGGLGAGL